MWRAVAGCVWLCLNVESERTMVTSELIAEKIRAAIPDAEVVAEDYTGGGDHWSARVVASSFEGKLPIARQRLVYAALGDLMKGPIHALQLETLTPAQAAAK